MEYYLAIKRNGAVIHATIWMNIENIPSGKKKTDRKDPKQYGFTYMKYPKQVDPQR